MMFILTDDFAKEISKKLKRAYDMLVKEATNPDQLPPIIDDITAIACVGTIASMIDDNIGNDSLPKKKKVGMHAIKSI